VDNQGFLNLGVDNVSLSAAPVPEPGSLALLAMGALTLVSLGRRPKEQNGTQPA
jgi:PEP-CTERM motif-containing protein